VVPGDDPTLLFTNAGMNQFKDVFLGFDKRPYTRATTSQKCIRAGGKHNDLDNVGYTARHHTFFEMLGNFSFGDYFKHDAISYAWELLTVYFKLPADKLWVTVYAEDDEAYDIWNKTVGVPAERIVRIGDNKGARYASDNFWMMGDTGPCGPCTEIFYDHGEDIPGGPPGSPDEDGDRYIEIWNNVFMQFNRTEDGVMHKLPKPSVDTGMGLERLAAVLQHVHSQLRDRPVRAPARGRPRRRPATPGGRSGRQGFAVAEGHRRPHPRLLVHRRRRRDPGNEGRGYVLRRIARRAIRHGYKLGARTPFFHKLVAALVAEMGDAYPELRTRRPASRRCCSRKRSASSRPSPRHGDARGGAGRRGAKQIDGETAFKLHDTFGFPVDLTADVCRERGSRSTRPASTLLEGSSGAAPARPASSSGAGPGLQRRAHAVPRLRAPGRRDGKVVALYVDGAR
jgi:alanyl-tRNA synthetase